ncbi:hypothetical protein AgCh_011360 [Apium graveolens]
MGHLDLIALASHNLARVQCLSSPQTVSSVSSSQTVSSSRSDEVQKFHFLSDIYIYNEIEETELEDELLLLGIDEPNTYCEAAVEKEWKRAMQSEIEAIERNKTWKLVELPTGQRAIGLKWVYKLKRDTEEKIVKYKARLVAKGYVQKIIIESECSEAIDLVNGVQGDWVLAYELKIIDMWKAKKEWKVEFTLADKYQNEEVRAVTVLALKEATLSVFDSEEPLHILWKILQAAKMA